MSFTFLDSRGQGNQHLLGLLQCQYKALTSFGGD
jgi:hypothetical protein